MARTKGILPFSGNFEVQSATPFDARGVVSTLLDLTNSDTWVALDGSDYSYKGLLTCVTNDITSTNNGLYRLKELPPTVFNNWEKIGSESSSGGEGSFYQRSFTEAELVENKIVITHNLGDAYFTYTLFNNFNAQVIPNNVTVIDSTSFELDLTNIAPIEGSYTIFVLTRGGGTTDYEALENKPQINGVELLGNKTSDLFNLVGSFNKSVTNVQVMTQAQYDATPAFAKGYMIYIIEDGETSYRKIIFFNETNVPTIVYDSTNLAGSSVLYTAQTLTDEQKTQAQTNIDAQSASTSTFQNDKLERAILFPYDFEQLGVEIPTISKAIKGLYLTNYDFAKDYYLNVVQMDNGAGNARIRIISRLKAMFLTTATELEILAPIEDTTSDLEIKYEDTEGRGIVLINWGELPENYNMTGMSGGYKLDLSIFSKNNPLVPSTSSSSGVKTYTSLDSFSDNNFNTILNEMEVFSILKINIGASETPIEGLVLPVNFAQYITITKITSGDASMEAQSIYADLFFTNSAYFNGTNWELEFENWFDAGIRNSTSCYVIDSFGYFSVPSDYEVIFTEMPLGSIFSGNAGSVIPKPDNGLYMFFAQKIADEIIILDFYSPTTNLSFMRGIFRSARIGSWTQLGKFNEIYSTEEQEEIFVIPNAFLDLPNSATYEQMFTALGVTTENEITDLIDSWCSYKTFIKLTQNPTNGEITRLFLDVKTTTIEDATTFQGDSAYAPDFKVTMNDGTNITSIRFLRNTGLWQFTKTIEAVPQYAEKSSQVEESSATPVLDLVDNTDYTLTSEITSLTINTMSGTGSIRFATALNFDPIDFVYPDNTLFASTKDIYGGNIYLGVFTDNILVLTRVG